MSRKARTGLGAFVVFICVVSHAFGGGLVGPAPSDDLREFGAWSLGMETTWISEHDFTKSAKGRGGEFLLKASFTILDRIDLELLGGGTYLDIEEDRDSGLTSLGWGTLGGVGVNINAYRDRITKIDIGVHGRFTQSSPNSNRWSEWWFASTLGRPFEQGNGILTPYVGVKFSQVDTDVNLKKPIWHREEVTEIVGSQTEGGIEYYELSTSYRMRKQDSIKFEERRRVGVLAGLRYTFQHRNELVLEVQTADQTALCFGYRRIF